MRKKKNGKNYRVGNERKEANLGRLVFWGSAGEEKPADVKNVGAAKTRGRKKNGAAKLVEKNGKELVKNTDNYVSFLLHAFLLRRRRVLLRFLRRRVFSPSASRKPTHYSNPRALICGKFAGKVRGEDLGGRT